MELVSCCDYIIISTRQPLADLIGNVGGERKKGVGRERQEGGRRMKTARVSMGGGIEKER